MNVSELIAKLEDFDPDSEVKLAVQPEWAFQHGVAEAVEITPDLPGFNWGVIVRYIDGTDEEFTEGQANTRSSARDLYEDLTSDKDRMKDNGIMGAYVAGMMRGEVMTEAQAEEFLMDQPAVVFISESGQECYLPEAVQETLGWSRR